MGKDADIVKKIVSDYVREKILAELGPEATRDHGDHARMARAIGISGAHFSNIINGKMLASAGSLEKIARHFWRIGRKDIIKKALRETGNERFLVAPPHRKSGTRVGAR